MAFSKRTDVHRLPTPKSGEVLHFDGGKPSERVPGLALPIVPAALANSFTCSAWAAGN